MGIFRPIVEPVMLAVLDLRQDLAPGGVGAGLVGYDPLRQTSLLTQEPRHHSPRGLCVPAHLHDFVEDVPVLIDSAPEIAFLAIDGDDDLVETPYVAAARRLALQAARVIGAEFDRHAAAHRAGSFVAVNCAALPERLIEAELFGYADGAYTGARKGGSVGLFREADGGTLFLDEIGDMPVTLQAVLLRFLDDWTVRPIGGAKRQLDVVLVSATNLNLAESIARGRFRPDLLFRLNALEVTLPALHERSASRR